MAHFEPTILPVITSPQIAAIVQDTLTFCARAPNSTEQGQNQSTGGTGSLWFLTIRYQRVLTRKTGYIRHDQAAWNATRP